MISARQLKNILDTSFSAGAGTSAISVTATFTASPSTYLNTSIPGTVALSGTIVPGVGALFVTWQIKDNLNNILETGVGNNVAYSLTAIPTTIGSHPYTLFVFYQDATGTPFSDSFTTVVGVTSVIKVGQLLLPGDDITVPGDLSGGLEATFATYTNTEAINLFPITTDHTGRLVIIVPDYYGTLSDISDNTDSSVLTEFHVVTDSVNGRKMYVSLNAVTPATYHYKLVF
jgi:hypothetical protein